MAIASATLCVFRVMVRTDVFLNPIEVEAHAAVVGPGAVAAHFRMRCGAALVRDALRERAMEQHARVRGGSVLLPCRDHPLARLGREHAVVVVLVLARRLDRYDNPLAGIA